MKMMETAYYMCQTDHLFYKWRKEGLEIRYCVCSHTAGKCQSHMWNPLLPDYSLKVCNSGLGSWVQVSVCSTKFNMQAAPSMQKMIQKISQCLIQILQVTEEGKGLLGLTFWCCEKQQSKPQWSFLSSTKKIQPLFLFWIMFYLS